MQTQCPFCQEIHPVENGTEGRKLQCRKCSQSFFIQEYQQQTLPLKSEDITLKDIHQTLRSIRKILLFFFWLTLISLILGFLGVL